MAQVSVLLSLAGYLLGAIGGLFVFIELFQVPSYVEYDASRDTWHVESWPLYIDEYTWFGRVGALLIAIGFALLFLGALIG